MFYLPQNNDNKLNSLSTYYMRNYMPRCLDVLFHLIFLGALFYNIIMYL